MNNAATPNKRIILLTGCINPNGMFFTKLQNPVLRREQYIEAIHFYLQKLQLPILFVENSGTDISAEFNKEIETGRLEILTWNGNDYPKNLGKGFGEMLIIEHALQNSYLMQKADFIFKITGRYKILNIINLLGAHNYKNTDVYADLYKASPFSDSRFWGAKKSFFCNILVSYKNKINDSAGYIFEFALSEAVHNAVKLGYSYSALQYLPRYSGIYGTDNVPIKSFWALWYLKNIKHAFIKIYNNLNTF